jgi:hypothetical protein
MLRQGSVRANLQPDKVNACFLHEERMRPLKAPIRRWQQLPVLRLTPIPN